MNSRVAWIFALFLTGVAGPSLKASTVTFIYTGADVGSTEITGSGSFSYNGSLASITLSNLTAFSFELDENTPGSPPPQPAVFDFGLSDLETFSATVSGGVVTALSLSTDSQAATNSDNFDETQRILVVNSLATGGAAIEINETDLTKIVGYDTGTITTQGPGGAQTPEPSTALLTGGAGLLLFLWRRTVRAPRA